MDIERGLRIPVYGLGCGGAGATTIGRELAATDGVVSAYVNPATETAYVDYDPAEVDPGALVRAIERAGYGAGARSRPGRCASRDGRFGGRRRWPFGPGHHQSGRGAARAMPASPMQAHPVTERRTHGR